jgi:hypothetical protein
MEGKMNTMRSLLLLIAAITLGAFAACNYTVGECWYYGEGSENAGAGSGGGVIIPTGPAGVGGYGEAPPKQPQDTPDPRPEPKCNSDDTDDSDTNGSTESPKTESTCTEADREVAFWICGDDDDNCSLKCATGGVTGGPFGAAAFQFVTTLPDDGTGEAGGWQVAAASLRIVRLNYGIIPEIWHCPIKIGMPLRTKIHGPISPHYAATITAQVANRVARKMKVEFPDLPQGIYCAKMKSEMVTLFASTEYKSYGARMEP